MTTDRFSNAWLLGSIAVPSSDSCQRDATAGRPLAQLEPRLLSPVAGRCPRR